MRCNCVVLLCMCVVGVPSLHVVVVVFTAAVGRGVATTFWSIQQPSTAPVDHILEYCYQVGNATNPPLVSVARCAVLHAWVSRLQPPYPVPPQVHSLSYGMAAANVDTYQGAGYLERSDNELAKLALRGLTIIIASGDAGVGLIVRTVCSGVCVCGGDEYGIVSKDA